MKKKPDSRDDANRRRRALIEFSNTHIVSANMRAIFNGLLDGDDSTLEIWGKEDISTAMTYYDDKKDKHVIFIGSRIEQYPNTEKTEDRDALVYSLLAHEIGHVLYTTKLKEDLLRTLQQENIPMQFWNLFEDARIEHLIREDISANIGSSFYFEWENWLDTVIEAPNMEPEQIFYAIINSDNKRSINALKYPAVKKFYDRVINANDTFEVIDIIVDWRNYFHSNWQQQQQQQNSMSPLMQGQSQQQQQGQQGQQSQEGQGQGQGENSLEQAMSSLQQGIKNGIFGSDRQSPEEEESQEEGSGLSKGNEDEDEKGESFTPGSGKRWKRRASRGEEDEKAGADGQEGEKEESAEENGESPYGNKDKNGNIEDGSWSDDLAEKHFTDQGEVSLAESGRPATLEEMRVGAIPIAGMGFTEQAEHQQSPVSLNDKPGIQTLNSYSNTESIFSSSNQTKPIDETMASKIVKHFEDLEEETKSMKEKTDKPKGHLNDKMLALLYANPGRTKAYTVKREAVEEIDDMKLCIIVDTSGSMSGFPAMAQRLILFGMNRLATKFPGMEIDIVASFAGNGGTIYQTVRLPISESALLGMKDGGGSGITPSLAANKKLLQEKDASIFITDGMLGDADRIDKKSVEKFFGPKCISVGYYPGESENAWYNKDMEKWFDRFFVGTDVPSAVEGIVEFLNECKRDGNLIKRVRQEGSKESQIVVEVENVGPKR